MNKDPKRLEDELLVLRAQAGGREAFRALFERWRRPLLRHAHRVVGADDAALDVAQEAWLAIARGLGGLRDPGGFATWAYTIVGRRAADWLRGGARHRAGALEEEPAAAEEAEPSGPVELMRRALAALPVEKRSLLSLVYADGLTVAETAAVLGIPAGTVKSRLHHAREELRVSLERLER